MKPLLSELPELGECDDDKVKLGEYPDEWLTLSLGGTVMKLINIHEFYQLGVTLDRLTSIKNDVQLKDIGYKLIEARSWLERLLDDSIIPLTICKPAAQKILDEINKLMPPGDREVWSSEEIVEFYSIYIIHSQVHDFKTIFSAEVRNLATYFVSKKSIYQTNDLIQKADELFPESIREKFTGQVTYDLREAGKCLAFDLSTAAGFHIARAVEGVLFEWLKIICPAEIQEIKESQRNLGNYIKMASGNGGDPKVCSSLDQFRDLHRNPLIHPETVLTVDEALTLLGIAQSAIVSMILDGGKRTNPSALTP